jgi:hypothetical protein
MEENAKDSLISPEKRREYTINAREWQTKGGMIPWLMKNVEGFRQFYYDEIVEKNIPASAFLDRMRKKFPNLDEELYPSAMTVYNFKKHMRKDVHDEKLGLAMKSEIKILDVMAGFNYFEERKALYDKAGYAVELVEKAISHILDWMARKDSPPPPDMYKALDRLSMMIDLRAKHLDELDKLSVRFGLMPAREERNIIFAQQNNNTIMMNNDDYDEVVAKLGLEITDFQDDKLIGTMEKVMQYYSKEYGIGEQQPTRQQATDRPDVIDGTVAPRDNGGVARVDDRGEGSVSEGGDTESDVSSVPEEGGGKS